MSVHVRLDVLLGLFGVGLVASYLLGRRSKESHPSFFSRVKQSRKDVFAKSKYARELQVATELAMHAAGNIHACINDQRKAMTLKGIGDLVTNTDVMNEKMIFDRLRSEFPGHVLIGEESVSANKDVPLQIDDRPTWIVDPIDGTTNFFHGLPVCCTSIAFVVRGEVVVGAVCSATGELFQSIRGCGAYCNGVRINSQKIEKIQESIVLTEWGSQRNTGLWNIAQADHAHMVKGQCHSIRQLGSGVLDLCFVAAGRAGAVYCGVGGQGWFAWDYAAGSLIAEEAGCVVSAVDGSTFDLLGKSILVAANHNVAREVQALVAPHISGSNDKSVSKEAADEIQSLTTKISQAQRVISQRVQQLELESKPSPPAQDQEMQAARAEILRSITRIRELIEAATRRQSQESK